MPEGSAGIARDGFEPSIYAEEFPSVEDESFIRWLFVDVADA